MDRTLEKPTIRWDPKGQTWLKGAKSLREKDRGVLGWFSDGTLYIAGSKRIIAPEDCSYLFSDKTSDNDNNENWGNLKLIENARILDTSNVENMKNMFYNCRSLKSIDVSRWDTHIVKNMDKMFFGCKSLQEIDVSSFLTANVETMNCMFYGCQNLTSLGKKMYVIGILLP